MQLVHMYNKFQQIVCTSMNVFLNPKINHGIGSPTCNYTTTIDRISCHISKVYILFLNP